MKTIIIRPVCVCVCGWMVGWMVGWVGGGEDHRNSYIFTFSQEDTCKLQHNGYISSLSIINPVLL